MWRKYFWKRFNLTVEVYLPHDNCMGQVRFPNGYVSPNMPKLHYAVNFKVMGSQVNVRGASFSGIPFHVFEKHDGFNLLAYRPSGFNEVLFKTRMLPEAGDVIRHNILTHELFPREQLIEMVNDGYIPIVEVYGPMLHDYHVGHGPVNVQRLFNMGIIAYLNVALLAVRLNKPGYPFVSPTEMMELAVQYDIPHATYFGTITLDDNTVFELMEGVARYNNQMGFIAREGYVLHGFINGQYTMLKVKPLNIMSHDVIGFTEDAVKKEIAKLVQDYDVESLVSQQTFRARFNELLEYLEEELKLTRRQKKIVFDIFCRELAQILKQQTPGITKEQAGRSGVHGAIIRFI